MEVKDMAQAAVDEASRNLAAARKRLSKAEEAVGKALMQYAAARARARKLETEEA